MAQMKIRGNTQIMPSSVSLDRLDASTQALINSGITFKLACRVASTVNLALSGTQTIDTVAVSVGDRVLVKNQTAAAENGIYVVAAGAWTRATDANSSANLRSGMQVPVNEGSNNLDTTWVLITDGTIVVGTTALVFTQASGLGQVIAGNGLTKSGNTIDVVAGNGIAVAADAVSVSLAADWGLEFQGGGVAIKTATNAGLIVDSSGLYINPGDGLEKVTNAVKVKLDTNPGLSISGTGIKVNAGDGIVVSGPYVAVQLDTNSGLKLTTGEGLSIDVGFNLEVDGGGQLRVVSDPSFDSVTLSPGGGEDTVISGDGTRGINISMGAYFNNFNFEATTAARSWFFPDRSGQVTLVQDIVSEEVCGGAINGTNTAFTLAFTPVAGVILYLNGTRLRSGAGNDFTISGTAITMLYAPETGDVLIATYWK